MREANLSFRRDAGCIGGTDLKTLLRITMCVGERTG